MDRKGINDIRYAQCAHYFTLDFEALPRKVRYRALSQSCNEDSWTKDKPKCNKYFFTTHKCMRLSQGIR